MDNSNKYLIKWVNLVLNPRNITVNSVADFRDGFALTALIEEISGKKSKFKLAQPKNELFCMNNLNIAIQMIKDNKLVKQLCVDARNFYDGKDIDEKLIFGFIFDLVLHASVNGIQDSLSMLGCSKAEQAEKDALLQWCNLIIKPYNLTVSNFTDNWTDGKALGAIADSLLDDDRKYFNNLTKNCSSNEEKQSNLAANQQKINELLKIPPFLDPDFIQQPNDKANIVYLGMIYKQYQKFLDEMTEMKRKKQISLIQLAIYRARNLQQKKQNIDNICNEQSTNCSDITNQINNSGSEKNIEPKIKKLQTQELQCQKDYLYYMQQSKQFNFVPNNELKEKFLKFYDEAEDVQKQYRKYCLMNSINSFEDKDECNTELIKEQFNSLFNNEKSVKKEKFDQISQQFGIREEHLNELDDIDVDKLIELVKKENDNKVSQNPLRQAFQAIAMDGKIGKDELQKANLTENDFKGVINETNSNYDYDDFCKIFRE